MQLQEINQDSFQLVLELFQHFNISHDHQCISICKQYRYKYKYSPDRTQLSVIIASEIEYIQLLMQEGLFDLHPELVREKRELLAYGFKEMNKSDYKIVLDCIEKYGLLQYKHEHVDCVNGDILNGSNSNNNSGSGDGLVMTTDVTTEQNLIQNICKLTYKQYTYISRYIHVFSKQVDTLPDSRRIHEKSSKSEKKVLKEQYTRNALEHKANLLKIALNTTSVSNVSNAGSMGSMSGSGCFPSYSEINQYNAVSYMPDGCKPIPGGGSGIGSGDGIVGDGLGCGLDMGVSNTHNTHNTPNTQPTNTYLVPLLHPCNTNILTYSTTHRSRTYTEDEDIFLILMLVTHGFGADSWEAIRHEIRYRPPSHSSSTSGSGGKPNSSVNNYRQLFQFDWYLKSRTTLDLQRRCEVLIRMVEKEYERWLNKQGHAEAEGQGNRMEIDTVGDSIGIDTGTGIGAGTGDSLIEVEEVVVRPMEITVDVARQSISFANPLHVKQEAKPYQIPDLGAGPAPGTVPEEIATPSPGRGRGRPSRADRAKKRKLN